MRLVQLSDLHVHSPSFVPEWGDRVLRRVNELAADLVLVTGDLVDDGLTHQFEAASRFLRRLEAGALLVLPGNHDMFYNGASVFEELFGSRSPSFENDDVVIAGLDSTLPDRHDGHVGDWQYDLLRKRLTGRDEKYKIVAVHHHLLPVPGSGRNHDLVDDAGDVLRLCVELDVDTVLTGHLHRPWVWKLQETYHVSAGTATTNRFKGGTYPSFYCLELDERPSLVEFNVRDQTNRRVPLEPGRDRRGQQAPAA